MASLYASVGCSSLNRMHSGAEIRATEAPRTGKWLGRWVGFAPHPPEPAGKNLVEVVEYGHQRQTEDDQTAGVNFE